MCLTRFMLRQALSHNHALTSWGRNYAVVHVNTTPAVVDLMDDGTGFPDWALWGGVMLH